MGEISDPIQQGSHEDYDQAEEDGRKALQYLVALYLAGRYTLSQLRTNMREAIRDIHIRLMLLALGGSRQPTPADLAFLNSRLEEQYKFLDGFIADLQAGRLSDLRALWRSGLYASPRGSYVAYTIPLDVAMMMPVLPGDDCLGGSLCRCGLSVEYSQNQIIVHWLLDPESESCEVCIAHSIESPFVFSRND